MERITLEQINASLAQLLLAPDNFENYHGLIEQLQTYLGQQLHIEEKNKFVSILDKTINNHVLKETEKLFLEELRFHLIAIRASAHVPFIESISHQIESAKKSIADYIYGYRYWLKKKDYDVVKKLKQKAQQRFLQLIKDELANKKITNTVINHFLTTPPDFSEQKVSASTIIDNRIELIKRIYALKGRALDVTDLSNAYHNLLEPLQKFYTAPVNEINLCYKQWNNIDLSVSKDIDINQRQQVNDAIDKLKEEQKKLSIDSAEFCALERLKISYQAHLCLLDYFSPDQSESLKKRLIDSEKPVSFPEITEQRLKDIRQKVPSELQNNKTKAGEFLSLNPQNRKPDEWCADIIQIQHQLGSAIKQLLKELAEETAALLGITQSFCLLGLGSLSQGTFMPYSDIEYALLLPEKFDSDCYENFANLFNLQIKKLGEWNKDAEGVEIHEGFTIDPGATPPTETKLLASANALATNFNRDQESCNEWRLHDGMGYALFNPVLIYNGNVSSEENPLWQAYKKANQENQQSLVDYAELSQIKGGHPYRGITKTLPLYKARALACLECDLHSYFESTGSDEMLASDEVRAFEDFSGVNGKYQPLGEVFCAKKRLVKSLSYILLDLALYKGLSDGTVLGAIEKLCTAQENEKPLLTPLLKAELRLSFCQLTAIRIRQQYFYQKQYIPEKVVIPTAGSKEIFKDHYVLNEEEWDIIRSIEIRILRPFYQLLIDGLLNKNIAGQLDELKECDPVFYLMEKLLAKVANYHSQTEKPNIDETWAKDIIESYVLTLIQRKTVYQQHQRIYERLSIFLQQYYCHFFRQYDTSPQAKRIVTHWEEALRWFPKPNGERESVTEQNRQWEELCNQWFISQDKWNVLNATEIYRHKKLPLLPIKRTIIQSNSVVECVDSTFHPEVVNYLLENKVINSKGSLNSRDQYSEKIKKTKGQHLVVPIDVIIENQTIRMHVKFFPELPGIEYAAESLSRLLTGYGAPLTELVRLTLNNIELPIPLLISKTILGNDLDAQEKVLLNLNKLNSAFFSKAVLQAMVLNREDGKGDNTYLTQCPLNPDEHALMMIDSDRCFFSAVGRDEQGHLIPYVKEIIFCLPHMEQEIELTVIKEWLSLDLYALLKNWLMNYVQLEFIKITLLFNESEIKALFPKELQATGMLNLLRKIVVKKKLIKTSILPLSILEGDISLLYKKLHQLQTLLKKNPEIKPIELLKIIEPMLGDKAYRLDAQ